MTLSMQMERSLISVQLHESLLGQARVALRDKYMAHT